MTGPEQRLLKKAQEALEQATNILNNEPDPAAEMQNIRNAANQAADAAQQLNMLHGFMLAAESNKIMEQRPARITPPKLSLESILPQQDFTQEYQDILARSKAMTQCQLADLVSILDCGMSDKPNRPIISREQLRLAYEMAHAVEDAAEVWEICVYYDDTSYFFANYHTTGQASDDGVALLCDYLQGFRYSSVRMLSKLMTEQYVQEITATISNGRIWLEDTTAIAKYLIQRAQKYSPFNKN